MIKLYVARHGETDFNLQNRYAGSTDVDINKNGVLQAKELAKNIANKNIDVLLSSSKKRAVSTAKIVGKYIERHPVLMSEFVEIGLGVFEGLTREEVKEKYPDLWERKILSQYNNKEHMGESIYDVEKRTAEGLDIIKDKYKNKTILLITHGFTSRIIHGILSKTSREELNNYLLGNCKFAEYEIE